MVDYDRCAGELASARRASRGIESLVTRFPDMTLTEAYSVQRALVPLSARSGFSVIGYKVGLTTAEGQRENGGSEPVYGMIFEDMVLQAGDPLVLSSYLRPRLEPELAVIMGQSVVGPIEDVNDLAAAVESVCPAFEIIDSRFSGGPRNVVDLICDNSSAAGIVLGRPVAFTGRWDDLSSCRFDFSAAGHSSTALVMDRIPGGPVTSLQWLAGAVERAGGHLDRGDVVLTGSCAAPVPLKAGDQASIHFSGIGSLSILVGG